MLINCVAYQQGRKMADIPIEAISDYLTLPDCFVWVALHDPEASELARMQEEFGLHELAVEDALRGHQRPKFEEYGDTVFIALHLLEWVKGEIEVGEVSIFVGPNFVLSIRMRHAHGFLGVRQRCEREPELLRFGSGFVAYALIDAVVDRYFPVVEALESELEEIEESIFRRGEGQTNIQRLYELKRKSQVLRHAVVPLYEVTSKLYGGRVPPMFDKTREYFRDVFDHLARISGVTESIRDMIGTAIQVNLSMVTIEEGEVTKKLAAWAAIFGTATAFAGIWGMNFEFMPELKMPWGYPVALAIIIGVSLALYVKFRRAGWL